MTYDVLTQARRRRNRFLAACLVAAALTGSAVTVVVVLAAGASRSGTTPDRAVPPAAAAVASAAAGVPGNGGDGAGALPTDLTWSDLAGIALPVSARSGPRDTGAGLARGFAHDQGGAVLAAVHITARINPQLGPAVFEPTLRTQVVGAGATPMREMTAQAYAEMRQQAGVADGQPLGRLAATLRGYQVLSYRDDAAVLRLLIESAGPTGDLLEASTQVQMVWTGTDWALTAPGNGRFDEAVSVASPSEVAAFRPFNPGR